MSPPLPAAEHDAVLAGIKATPSGWPPASLDPGCGRRTPAGTGSPAEERIRKFRSLRFQGIAESVALQRPLLAGRRRNPKRPTPPASPPQGPISLQKAWEALGDIPGRRQCTLNAIARGATLLRYHPIAAKQRTVRTHPHVRTRGRSPAPDGESTWAITKVAVAPVSRHEDGSENDQVDALIEHEGVAPPRRQRYQMLPS